MRIVAIQATTHPNWSKASDPDHAIDVVADTKMLCERVKHAVPGEVIIYHVGMLAPDRTRIVSTLSDQERLALHAVATCAMRLADAGWAHLLQRRVGPERFAYLLIVRPGHRRGHSQRTMPNPSRREAA
jgi:hypothetical protein